MITMKTLPAVLTDYNERRKYLKNKIPSVIRYDLLIIHTNIASHSNVSTQNILKEIDSYN